MKQLLFFALVASLFVLSSCNQMSNEEKTMKGVQLANKILSAHGGNTPYAVNGRAKLNQPIGYFEVDKYYDFTPQKTVTFMVDKSLGTNMKMVLKRGYLNQGKVVIVISGGWLQQGKISVEEVAGTIIHEMSHAEQPQNLTSDQRETLSYRWEGEMMCLYWGWGQGNPPPVPTLCPSNTDEVKEIRDKLASQHNISKLKAEQILNFACTAQIVDLSQQARNQ